MAAFAHEDSALPIEEGQTISQPYIVALMAEAAEIKPADRVLDVGAGSGYAAAVLAELARDVYTIERHRRLCEQASERFRTLGYAKIKVRCGDGTQGWPEAAPFDAILVAAAGRESPPALLAQLKLGGRLIIPLGTPGVQTLWRIRRVADDRYERDDLGDVRFVPLVGDASAEAPAPSSAPR
jgi:protein-L-isoaspartate(D-aspartate) O-methyltransferase